MYYVYGSVRAIPTYRVYRLYDEIEDIQMILKLPCFVFQPTDKKSFRVQYSLQTLRSVYHYTRAKHSHIS